MKISRLAAAMALFGLILILVASALYWGIRLAFPTPHLKTVRESGGNVSLVYAIAKAESGFREHAKSKAGAVGLMQLMPETAKFICATEHIGYDEARLSEGEYNLKLGCLYLNYLRNKFPEERTVLAAYNAGEGVVAKWLADGSYSADGKTLSKIPYPETERYVKKVEKFRKIYEFFY